MRYRTLFTLPMLARAGLALTLVIWVVASMVRVSGSMPVSDFILHISVTDRIVIAKLPPERAVGYWDSLDSKASELARRMMEGLSPIVSAGGCSVWFDGSRLMIISINLWLLWLIFLIATIATSVSWRKSAKSESERTDE